MSILPLPVIVAQLTKINGCSEELAGAFLVEFADLVGAELADTGFAEIKGIGTFRRIDVGGVPTVEFGPDPHLAEAVNLPFAMFEPVELDEEVTEEMLDAAAEEAEAEASVLAPEDRQREEHEEDTDVMRDEASMPAVDMEPVKEIKDVASASEDEPAKDDQVTGEDPETAEIRRPSRSLNEKMAEQRLNKPMVTYERVIEKERVVENNHHTMNIVLTAFLSLLAGLLIGFFSYDKLNLNGVRSVNISAEDVQVYHASDDPTEVGSTDIDSTVVKHQSGLKVPVSQETHQDVNEIRTDHSEAVVTDTVRSGRFLTTMAQRHYGKKKFWVYIYLENRDKLGDPDMIPPMTIVTIPPASKYGIQPGNRDSEEKAERKAAEIMSRYSKNK